MESRDIETMIFEARMEAVWNGETIGGAMLAAQKVLAVASAELTKLKNERDSARRWVCHFLAHDRTQQARENGLSAEVLPQDVADDQGWDCFKRTTT